MDMHGLQNIKTMEPGFTKPTQMRILLISIQMDLVDLKSIIQPMVVLLLEPWEGL